VVRMNQTYKVGPSKSLKVFPGDKVDLEVWEYHESSSGHGTTSTPSATLINLVASAFGGVSGAPGESGLIFTGVNSAITGFVPGGNQGDTRPAAYLNYILFDANYKVLDMGWRLAPATAFTKQQLSFPTITIKEAGTLFTYLSYDDDSNNWVYFDDLKVSHTKSNLIQCNEYYPFGLQTANSWTRQNALGNAYLYNEGSELNSTTAMYDLPFRNYDAALGRFMQVDPLALSSVDQSPYHYAGGDPVFWNDPMGLEDVEPSTIGRKAPRRFASDGGGYGYWEQGYDNPNSMYYGIGGPVYGTQGYGAYRNEMNSGAIIGRNKYGDLGFWVDRPLEDDEVGIDSKFTPLFALAEQGNYQVLQAGFGYGEGLGSAEILLAGLKPTFDRAAHFARSQGKVGQVPLYLIKNVFKSPLLENNKALYIGKVGSSTALGTANTLSKLAPALTGLGVLTTGYDIIKDGQLTAGDGFQAINTGLMIAFPVYGVIYGAVDLGFGLFSDQSLTDRIKSGIDSNVSGSIEVPKF
jgi:RHS repeat-associated protein